MCSLQNGPKKSRARSRDGSGGACARCKMRRHLRSSLSGCLNFLAPFCGSVNAIADRAMFFRLPAMGNSAAPPKYRCPGNGQEMLARPAAIFRHHKQAPRVLRFSGLVCLVEPGRFEPHFLLRIDLPSPALLGPMPRFVRFVAHRSAADFRHGKGGSCSRSTQSSPALWLSLDEDTQRKGAVARPSVG